MISPGTQPISASVPGSTYKPMSQNMQHPLIPPTPMENLSGPTDFVLVEVKITLPNGHNLKASGKLSTSELSSRREPAINCIEQALRAVTEQAIQTLHNSASMVLRSSGH